MLRTAQGVDYLGPGDPRSRSVRALQQAINVYRLANLEFPAWQESPALGEDGVYDFVTEVLVRTAQNGLGITEDGLAGPETLSALSSALAVRGLGNITFGPPTQVTPVLYVPTVEANDLRMVHGLPEIPLEGSSGGFFQALSPIAWVGIGLALVVGIQNAVKEWGATRWA